MTNHLVNESSAYLKMHGQNPVEWYPWGSEALEKAEKENKPILLSIGYTACHWCHVMAHESFEDDETALLMNKNFINIKVDREERPDLDKVYQLSAQLLTRQVGGWPLTIFLMPKTKIPFFAGTYFPKNRMGNYPTFKEVLQYVSEIFKQNKNELLKQNTSFQNIIKELEAQANLQSPTLNTLPIMKSKKALEQAYDSVNGGFGHATKFPMTPALRHFLLHAIAGDTNSKQKLIYSLEKMICGGLYDQIGNGFFRYTVDNEWRIPHFEKMLYDNALLLALMSETYGFLFSLNNTHSSELQLLHDAMQGTAGWLLKEMQAETGGFYATLAADTEGEEGKYYIWSKEEIEQLLTKKEYEILSVYYGLNSAPNFEDAWHLQIQTSIDELVKELNIDHEEVGALIRSARKKIYEHRLNRISPQRDEKIIVSWNGLAIKALAMAGLYLKEDEYISSAENAVSFIFKNLWINNQLYSIHNDGVTKELANLDDYVFLIEGILTLLQTKWNIENFNFLLLLVNNLLNYFEDKNSGGFYFTSNDHEKLIYRFKQYNDEALPSSDAIAAKILLQLGFILGDVNLLTSVENNLKNAFPHLEKYSDSCCSFLESLWFFFEKTQAIIIRGSDESFSEWRDILLKYYHPNRNAFFINREQELPSQLSSKKTIDETVAYFCINHQCLAPIKNLQDFENELRSNQFGFAK